MKKKHLFIFAALALALVLWITTRSSVKVAVIPKPPWAYPDETSGKLVGFEVDLVQAVAEKLGKHVVWTRDENWALLARQVKACNVDIAIGGLNQYSDLEASFSTPYLPAGAMLVVNKSDTRFDQTITADLDPHDYEITDYRKYCGVSSDGLSTLYRIRERSLDGIFYCYPVALYWTNQNPNQYKMVGDVVGDEQISMAVCRKDTKLLAQVNESLAQLEADGSIDSLVDKWFPKASPDQLVPTPTVIPVKALAGFQPQSACLDETYFMKTNSGETDTLQFDDLRNILADLGLQIVEGRSDCDINIRVDLTLTPFANTYSGLGTGGMTCYEGAKVEGTFQVSMGGMDQVFPISGIAEPPSTIPNAGGCTQDPRYAPYSNTGYPTQMLDSLASMWSNEIYLAALMVDNTGSTRYQAARRAFWNMNQSEAVPILIDGLSSVDLMVRRNSSFLLEEKTGQNFGEDAEAWREWWDGVSR